MWWSGLLVGIVASVLAVRLSRRENPRLALSRLNAALLLLACLALLAMIVSTLRAFSDLAAPGASASTFLREHLWALIGYPIFIVLGCFLPSAVSWTLARRIVLRQHAPRS